MTMKWWRKGLYVATSILLLGMLTGCRQTKTSQTDSTNTQVNQTTTSSTKEKKAQLKNMDLKEIQAGNYQSLNGKWQEVALNTNYHNQFGNIWTRPSGNATIEITDSSISTLGMKLEKEQLTYNEQQFPVTYQEQDGKLHVQAGEAVLWDIDFCPRNVPIMQEDPDFPLPKTIDPTHEHIMIRTSAGPSISVLERVDNQKDIDKMQNLENAGFPMNVAEIIDGDFSTIVGTWKNELGETIEITKDKMVFSDIAGGSQHAPGTVTAADLKVDIPKFNDEKGEPVLEPYIMGQYRPKYIQQLEVEQGQSYDRKWGFVSPASQAPLYIAFFPVGFITVDGQTVKEEAITSFFTQSSINLDYAALHGEVYHRVTK